MEEICRKITDHAEVIGKDPTIIAIDGRCGSGKSTVAAALSAKLGAPVVHMDDFFLRPEQRTAERLALPGGNSDRERLVAEVIVPLMEGREPEYGVYSCSTGTIAEKITLPKSKVYIIEGSYSCHPDLWEYADLHVFLTIDPPEQMQRIIEREGAERAEMFRTRWIPMEEKYFNTFGIAERCELLFDMTNGNEGK